jgi:lipoprotein signal peptidase
MFITTVAIIFAELIQIIILEIKSIQDKMDVIKATVFIHVKNGGLSTFYLCKEKNRNF